MQPQIEVTSINWHGAMLDETAPIELGWIAQWIKHAIDIQRDDETIGHFLTVLTVIAQPPSRKPISFVISRTAVDKCLPQV